MEGARVTPRFTASGGGLHTIGETSTSSALSNPRGGFPARVRGCAVLRGQQRSHPRISGELPGLPCVLSVFQRMAAKCRSPRSAEQPLLLLSTSSSNFHRQCNSPRLVGSFRFYPCQRRCITQCFRMFSTTQASSSHTTHRVAPPAGSLAGWPMSGVWAPSHPTYRNTIFHSR